MQYRKLKNLFLRQSCLDSWADYERSLNNSTFIKWDYVILTASNEAQAQTYRDQIERRREQDLLPASTHYAVLPDPGGKRVGSGGATFGVLRYLAEQEHTSGRERCNRTDPAGNPSADSNLFRGLRILVIHSGGDSKRIPQYSAIGKLFSPVPRELPDGRGSTLFDEFIIGMSGVPSRIAEGMLVLSGDVILLFNPLQIDVRPDGAAAISAKAPVEVGVEHGVFLSDGANTVKKFLHKQSKEHLEEIGAVNGEGNVNLDTGAVLFGSGLLMSLFSLISADGRTIDEQRFSRFCSEESRISFYGDFLYPLASDASLEGYLREAAEGEINDALLSCRREIWEAIHRYGMKLISLSPAEFIHLGTTKELWQLVTQDVQDYEYLDWKLQVSSSVPEGQYAAHNSYVGRRAKIGRFVYAENAYVIGDSVIGDHTILSHVRIENRTIPSEVVLHGLELPGDRYVVRIYGMEDTPKAMFPGKVSFLGSTLNEFIAHAGLGAEDLWRDPRKGRYLWFADLYPVCCSHEEALDAAELVFRIARGTASGEDIRSWQSAERMSLYSSFNAADTRLGRMWEEALEDRILANRFDQALEDGEDCGKALAVFGKRGLSKDLFDLLIGDARKAEFSQKIRIYYALSRYMKETAASFGEYTAEALESACFGTIEAAVCSSAEAHLGDIGSCRIAKERVDVALPLRVNWGGGWTDTPPQCMEMGGAVLNAAVRLNGSNPVQVTVRRIDEPVVQLESRDIGVYTEITDAALLQDCHNPYDSFALHKAALIACGIIPVRREVNLQEILRRLGGGIYLSSQAYGVPQGSGLGTSSILAGACVKGIFEFLGRTYTDGDLYQTVLAMEQIMSTGGGWQDQVGGLTNGVKMITTVPGIDQQLRVEKVLLPDAAKEELQQRFALIYTGQRRLARNLLRDVVGGYIGGRKESIDALRNMKAVAVLMRFALEQGDIDEFASLLNVHWKLSCQLDAGSTNTCIDQIFLVCEELIDGRFICGAGGGGFLQVIMKKGVTRDMLRERLRGVFQDSGVDVWDCELLL